MNNSKQTLVGVIFTASFILAMVFAVAAFFLLPPAPESNVRNHLLNIYLMALALFGSMVGAVLVMWGRFVQYAQCFYDLPYEEAKALVWRLIMGLRQLPPKSPILRVQEGRADPEGPMVVHKVGGPGHLSVAHDNAVVTHRMGKLHRVLEPGFYDLDPFERVWDVVDLRPQRRKISVDFTTLDGIPASCEAEMLFRVATPDNAFRFESDDQNIQNQPYGFFAEEAALNLATLQFVRSREGSRRVDDWRHGISNGALDGDIRDLLERYKLDELLTPPGQEGAGPSLHELTAIVREAVSKTAAERGMIVQEVELSPIRPAEASISRQWLEYWQAQRQRDIVEQSLDDEARRLRILEGARTRAQAELINSIFEEVQALNYQDVGVRPESVVISFISVLRTMADSDPIVQQLMFQQAEKLMHIVNAVQKDEPPFGTEGLLRVIQENQPASLPSSKTEE